MTTVQRPRNNSVNFSVFGSTEPFTAAPHANMRSVHDPNHKGNVAEMVITTEAMKLGVDVMKPLGEHTRYEPDL